MFLKQIRRKDNEKIAVVLMVIISILGLTSCNYQLIDTTYSYEVTIIQLANGEVVEVEIKSWQDYEGEQLQITAKDGTVYLTSSFRCDLIKTSNEIKNAEQDIFDIENP